MGQGQPRAGVHQVGVVPLGEVNHVTGQSIRQINKPDDSRFLVMMAERGTWRVRAGFHTVMPDENIGSDILDGTGAWRLDGNENRADRKLTIPAPDVITMRGYANNSVLTFYWV